MNDQPGLLAPDEPSPVNVTRPGGASPFFLACEHAGKRIPRRLGSLGLDDYHLERHIAWDIGAEAVALDLSARLDATLVSQTYSRLVIDCNRDPLVETSIPTISEATEIPGNKGIAAVEVQARADEIFHPYQERMVDHLDSRDEAGQPSVLIDVHSFTPVFHGEARPWHIGVLHNEDSRLAHILLDLMDDIPVGDNQPYEVDSVNDYTIPVHGEQRGIPHVEFEIRQDLITLAAGQEEWADRLESWLTKALDRLRQDYPGF
jgi:predicted N-formylglutamate amidohydrolase